MLEVFTYVRAYDSDGHSRHDDNWCILGGIFGCFDDESSGKVGNKSLVCDDWIDISLGTFTLSGMCADCVLVHGASAEKIFKITVSYVFAIKSDGVQLTLMQINLDYDLYP
jgi:hypothetical protein